MESKQNNERAIVIRINKTPHFFAGKCTQHKMVLEVSNTANFAKPFAVKYHDKFFLTTLPSESVGTYVW